MSVTIDEARVEEALANHRKGYTLDALLYHSQAAFERDLDAIYRSEWVFAGCSAELPNPGDHITLQIGPDGVILVRGHDDEIRAFHNTCRHRGSKICLAERGSSPRLVCPYHQWTYDLSGRLIHTLQMGPSFDPTQHNLLPIHVEVVCGLIYICLADSPPDFSRFKDAITPYLAPHEVERTKVAYQSRIVENANWKLVIENNRECYHCAGSHPELLGSIIETMFVGDPSCDPRLNRLLEEATTLWDSLDLPYVEVPAEDFRCIRMPFDHGAMSMTNDGRLACKVLMGDLEEPRLGSVRLFKPPGNWNHICADHSVHFRTLPISPDKTELVTTWLVHEDAVEGIDYDVEHLTATWIATNDQDRMLSENNHLGTLSSGYRPGPYSETEQMVAHFVDWYVARARREPSEERYLVAAE